MIRKGGPARRICHCFLPKRIAKRAHLEKKNAKPACAEYDENIGGKRKGACNGQTEKKRGYVGPRRHEVSEKKRSGCPYDWGGNKSRYNPAGGSACEESLPFAE